LFEFSLFSDMREGPLRSGVIVLASAVGAALLAYVLHRTGMLLLRQVARNRPFTRTATMMAWRSSQLCALLFSLRVVLTGAPADTPALVPLSYLTSVALILAITWLIIQCIESVSTTITNLNPLDVSDNLKARQVQTQTRVLARSANVVAGVIGVASVLMTLPGARQIGASLLASAGVAGLVAGMAARPVLGNLLAGLQIAFSQPIRMDDVLIVKGEWGRVEEITGTFVVVRIWDERRMIVPLQWFIENPFENWTHTSSSLLGTVFLWLDFNVPVPAIRDEFERVCKASSYWDGRVCVLQVTDASERAMQIRLLVSAQDSGVAFELRCQIREALIAFISAHYPGSLPRLRSALDPFDVREPGSERTAMAGGIGDGIIDGDPRQP
jgi:hypothetical protein